MFHHVAVGKPKCCLNRNCKTPYTAESHLGWQPYNEYEAYVIMRCPKCKDTRQIRQLYSMVHDYKSSLPKTNNTNKTPITKNEILNFRKKLEQKDSLKNLYEGLKPNGSVLEDDIEKK